MQVTFEELKELYLKTDNAFKGVIKELELAREVIKAARAVDEAAEIDLSNIIKPFYRVDGTEAISNLYDALVDYDKEFSKRD